MNYVTCAQCRLGAMTAWRSCFPELWVSVTIAPLILTQEAQWRSYAYSISSTQPLMSSQIPRRIPMYTRSVRCFLVHLTLWNKCVESYCSFLSLATEHSYELHSTDFIPDKTENLLSISIGFKVKSWVDESKKKRIFRYQAGSSWK